MAKSKIRITNLELTTSSGQIIGLSIEESKELYQQLHELFGSKEAPKEILKPYPVYVDRYNPYWQSVRPNWYSNTEVKFGQISDNEIKMGVANSIKTAEYKNYPSTSKMGMTVQGSSLRSENFTGQVGNVTGTAVIDFRGTTMKDFEGISKKIEESTPKIVSSELTGPSGLKVKFTGVEEE